MITQSDAALAAWRATERTLDAKVTITDSNGNSAEYSTSDITSIAYDSGAWTGDTFSIGSTYENNITVTFAHLVEGLKQGYKVTAKIGIKLPDGTYEYCPLGVFIISDEITMDRNNDATTIKAYDQFCVMQGTYTSRLTYPAKVTDVIAEIANMSGVELNTDDIAELPTQADLASAISGQTYCTAIGWIAQFYGGFALFDRDGKLTIRTVTDASYILDASQYEQSGLTKNEATYQIGGMSVSVTTTTTDSTGESSETTSTLVAGETTGSQIELTNNVMTQTRLDSIWSTIKDITFYPYSLTWFGNPAVEAGDWLTLKDTKGNSFNVPNNSYTMTFDGGLTATSKADQTSTSSSSYSYSGTLSQTVKELAGRIGATGNYIYGTDTTQEPNTAKIGDQWYKQNGNKVELWQYVRQPDGTGKWTLIVSDLTSVEISENVDKAMSEADTAKQNANTAVETGNQALTKAQSAIDAANAAADNANTANANASTALNNAATAIQQAQSAANDATSATNIANAVKQDVTTLKDGSTMTIAELESGLALKITKDDMNTALQPYATQSWTSTKISATADEINSSIASVKKTADGNATDVTSLKQRADGFDTSISNLTSTKADQSWTTNQIKASSDSLNVTIASVQTQVNNSAVGTNLLLSTSSFDRTDTFGTLGKWDYDPSIWSLDSSGNMVANALEQTSGNYDMTQFVEASPSTDYSAAIRMVWAQSNPNPSQFLTLYAVEYKDKSSITDTYVDHQFLVGNSTDITKTSTTFTTQPDCHYICFYIRCFYGWYIAFNKPKLELGSHATDYSANPADNATVTSVTAISATVNGLQTTVSKKVDNDTYQTQIQQLSDNINLRVQKNDVINQINVSSESILIAGNKVHITGTTTIDDAVIKSAMIDSISADKITAGTLNAANVNVINLNANNITSGTLTGVSFHQSSSGMNTWIDGNGIHNYNNSGGGVWIRNGMLEADGGTNGNAYISGDFGNLAFVSPDKHTLSVSEISGVGYYTGYDSVSNQGSGTMIANISLANDDTTLPTIVQSLYGIQIIDKSYGSSIDMSISGLHLSSSDSLAVDVFGKGMYVYTDFYVTGSKNAIVQTSAGWAKINAYETAEYYFGDIGETETGSGNSVEITMDSLFLETVNMSVGYQVFITPYSNAKIWVDERNSDNFVVKSDTPNVKFAYEIKAKRKGYENTRLEIDKGFGKEAA